MNDVKWLIVFWSIVWILVTAKLIYNAYRRREP